MGTLMGTSSDELAGELLTVVEGDGVGGFRISPAGQQSTDASPRDVAR
jgi:hypothetical protein